MRTSNWKTAIRSMGAMCLGAVAGLSAPAYADVSLATVPLFLTTQVSPNILLAIDDSGSMDGEVLFPTNDGAAWWNTTDRSFMGTGSNSIVLNFNLVGEANGTWKKFVYLFPNGQSGSYNGQRIYNDSTNDHYAIPPTSQFAWARSSGFNKAYFDPLSTYDPWPSTSTKTFTNSDPAAASVDPETTAAVFNLTADVRQSDANWRFRFFTGMIIDQGLELHGSSWSTLNSPVTVGTTGTYTNNNSYGVKYFPATFFSRVLLPSSYGYKGTPPRDGFAPGATTATLYRYEIKPANFDTTAQYQAAIQNFANWFTYYRKRHLATRGGIAQSFSDIRSARIGYFRINNRINSIPMRDLGDAAQRNAFLDGIYSSLNNIGFGGTPNRLALNHAGDRFRNQSNIIQYSCQANAAILFTDGYSNVDDTGVGNVDGGKGAPYADTASNTMADIAMRYYDSDLEPLRSGGTFQAGRVPIPSECSLTNRDRSLNCNRNLHMTTYAVTLGARGILYDPATPIDPYTNPPSWPTSFDPRHPSAVDDLWHATINGRGALLNANTPSEVSSELGKILDTILTRVSSASSVAANSTRLDTETLIYQAKFDSTDWSGEVLAYSVATNGDIADLVWSSNSTIPAHGTRTIATWNGTAGVNFVPDSWASLSSNQRTALGSEASGRSRISWMRGDRAQEIAGGGTLRNRTRVLGDIVNSDPVFTGSEDFGFGSLAGDEGALYGAFVTTKKTRRPMLYVGSNGGMLHGLDAETGLERLAYVPAGVYPKIASLTSPTYVHEYLVDGSARVSDAYIATGGQAAAWKTVVVGSTGAGGRSVFTLDVTNPTSFAPSNVLWELNERVGTHALGQTVHQPTIVRLNNGDWGAVFGNGYNSGETIKLFIVNLATGALIKHIDTGVAGTGNGLGPVAPIDLNGDRTADVVYAGDLKGNMWKFDISQSNTNQWDVAFKSGNTSFPLITVTDGTNPQPITSRPVVGRHPDGGYMVYFGTGSYFSSTDNVIGNNPQLQRFYAVRDEAARVVPAQLIRQTVVQQSTITNFGGARVYSKNPVVYSTGDKGWYLDLRFPATGAGNGERVVSTPILRFGRIIFTSIIPTADPCDFGGTSWLNELDAVNGGRLTYSVFDVNKDGLIDDNDFVLLTDGTRAPVGGKGFNEIIKTPGIIGAGEVEFKYTSGSSGSLDVTLEAGDPGPVGRQSWRQLR